MAINKFPEVENKRKRPKLLFGHLEDKQSRMLIWPQLARRQTALLPSLPLLETRSFLSGNYRVLCILAAAVQTSRQTLQPAGRCVAFCLLA